MVKLDPKAGPPAQPRANANAFADAKAQNASKKGKANAAGGIDGANEIEEDEDSVDTGSGQSSNKKATGGGQTFSAATSTPLGDRAHIINKDALDQKALAGPGSLDPNKLAQANVADARRWLAKRGIELLVPEGWRFMGMQLEGKAISFNHSGASDGHSVELSTWRLADDTPLEKFLLPYLEEAEEAARLGRLNSHEKLKLGDADGVLLIGWGPDDASALVGANPEQLFLATDGTGRRTMSWRGAVKRGDENQLIIVSLSSPIESFMDARAVYDAILKNARVVS